GPETARPVRLFQLPSEPSLIVRREREERVLDLTRQERLVVQVSNRLPLSAQQPLDALHDLGPARQKGPQKLDVRRKRHLAKTLDRHRPSLPRIAGRWCPNGI